MQIPSTLRASLITVVFALVVFHCFFTGLATFGFVGPDEPRYASIAREMARSGDWVTPRLNGAPWLEKPPLYYWSAAIGFRLFTTPEIAARVPSGIFALCAVLGILLVARRFYGRATALAVAWMLPATVAMTGFARAAATDMPFAACLTLAMVSAAFFLFDEHPAHPRAVAAAFGVALGLAVLAKGPAAILLAGGSAALWAVATGNFRHVWRLCHPVAVLAFSAVALPWYVLCAARNPAFLRTFLLEHNVERFLTNRYQHQQPLWFFLPVLLIAVFPWTLLLVPALTDAWRALRTADWRKSPDVFFAAWILFPLVFFSASQSKLPGYILPAVPPLVLLLARTLAGNEVSVAPAPRFRLLWISITLMAAGFAPFLRELYTTRGHTAGAPLDATGVNPQLTLLGFSLLLGGLAVAGASRMRRATLGTGIAAFLFSFSVGIAANHVLPVFDSQISPRELAFAARDLAPGAPIAVYHLPRAWQYGAEFYLDRALPEWSPAMPRPVWVIASPQGLIDMPRFGVRVVPTKIVHGRARIARVE